MESPGRPAPTVPQWWEPILIFIVTLEKATQGKFVNQGSDLIMEATSGTQKPNPNESFVRRAIHSQRVYRLRLGNNDLSGKPVRGASWETQGTDVVITVNPAHTGETVWTSAELLLQEIASAVAKNDPEQTPSGSKSIGTVDEMLTARLPYGSTDNSTPDEIKGLHKNTNAEVAAYMKNYIGRLTNPQISRVIGNASRANGVSLREIIHGVETNTPFRREQRRVGDRVFVTYEDPVGAGGGNPSHKTTFVPGADATAQPLLPGVGGQCNDQQKRVAANSCCTPAMITEIGKHLDTARAFTQRAITRLASEADTRCYLKQHFGAQGTTANEREIVNRLSMASGELFLSRHEWKCREAGSNQLGCKKEVYMVGKRRITETTRGVTPTGDIVIVMCVTPGASFIEWPSVLHEVVHRTGIVGEEKYEGSPGYPGGNAMENADSYASLVKDIGVPNFTACKS